MIVNTFANKCKFEVGYYLKTQEKFNAKTRDVKRVIGSIELLYDGEVSLKGVEQVIRKYRTKSRQIAGEKGYDYQEIAHFAKGIWIKASYAKVEKSYEQEGELLKVLDKEYEESTVFACADIRRILGSIIHHVVVTNELDETYQINAFTYNEIMYTDVLCTRRGEGYPIVIEASRGDAFKILMNPFFEEFDGAHLHPKVVETDFMQLRSENYVVWPCKMTEKMITSDNEYIPLFYGVSWDDERNQQRKGYFYFHEGELNAYRAIELIGDGQYKYFTSEIESCFELGNNTIFEQKLIHVKGGCYRSSYDDFNYDSKEQGVKITYESAIEMQTTDELEMKGMPLFSASFAPKLKITMEDKEIALFGLENQLELIGELVFELSYSESGSTKVMGTTLKEIELLYSVQHPYLMEWSSYSDETISDKFYEGDVELLSGIKRFVDKHYLLLVGVVKELWNADRALQNALEQNDKNPYVVELREIERKLFAPPKVPVREIATRVLDTKKEFLLTGKIPNFAIMGGPGTGKSTLVEEMAKCFVRNENENPRRVVIKSPSNLKGLYVGHTHGKTAKMIVDAAKNNEILFFDEAYVVFNDKFGEEAMSVLLPIISGDMKEITYQIEERVEGRTITETEVFNFESEGVLPPPIWMAGYELEMRKLLSANKGFYRRMKPLVIPLANASGLYDNLLLQIQSEKRAVDFYTQVMERNKQEVMKYFIWATSVSVVNYFGNFAGVTQFYATCKIRLQVGLDVNNPEHSETIRRIIEEKKKEIRRQYKADLTDVRNPAFEIQTDIKASFDSAKGVGRVVNSLKEIVEMLVHRSKYSAKGITVPKGALLVGPPGTGKTLIARAFAGEIQKVCEKNNRENLKVAFIAVAATELNAQSKIECLFAEAEEYDITVIFIDEIDVIGKWREQLGSKEELLIQLMKEMDGFEQRSNLFVLAATNAPEVLDPALVRPGRFDRTIEVSLPGKPEREEIIGYYMKKLELMQDSTIELSSYQGLVERMVVITLGMSPSELKNIINEAAIAYERMLKKSSYEEIIKFDIVQKFEEIIRELIEEELVGPLKSRKKEPKFSLEENEGYSSTAIHEVGHALMSILLKRRGLEKVTITPRGGAYGYVAHLRSEGKNTKKSMLNAIKCGLGGRVAEELFYEEDISTGASQDIRQVTNIARDMLMVYGMSDEIGLVATKVNTYTYLGGQSKITCSDAFQHEIDDAIRKMIKEELKITRNMLAQHKGTIEELARILFEKETMTGEEFMEEYEKIVGK